MPTTLKIYRAKASNEKGAFADVRTPCPSELEDPTVEDTGEVLELSCCVDVENSVRGPRFRLEGSPLDFPTERILSGMRAGYRASQRLQLFGLAEAREEEKTDDPIDLTNNP